MKVTLKDIAREAGVSEGTASLAVNNRPGVKQETRQRVLTIAKKYGYCPSLSAIHLSQKRSMLIGILIPHLKNLYYSSIVQAIENVLHTQGYRMILATTNNDPEHEREMLERFVSFGVDGVILYPLIRDHHEPKYLDILVKNGIPLVFLGGYYSFFKAPHCMSDLYTAIRQLIEHMHRGGCRKILYFGSCRTIVSNQIKIQAFTDAAQALGMNFDPEKDYVYLPQTNYDYAYQEAQRLLREGVAFDGVITGDCYSGFGVYQAMTENGKSIPDDVAIAHLDNFLKPSICVCRMTCIEQDILSTVDATIGLLNQAMAGRSDIQNALIPTRMIVRDSTRRIME